jgi:hypothetical protein
LTKARALLGALQCPNDDWVAADPEIPLATPGKPMPTVRNQPIS